MITQEDLFNFRAEIAPVVRAEIRAEIAPVRQALKIVIEMQMDPWEDILSITTEAVIEEEILNLDHVSDFYETPKRHYCMILGEIFNCHIACAHIWPKRTRGVGLTAFELKPDNVNSSMNFLRIHKTFEVAFDHKRIIFEVSNPSISTASTDSQFKLKLVVLDPKLLSENIYDNSKKVITTWKLVDRSDFHYTFVGEKKPYLRLLACQAFRAVEKAVNLGWIDASTDANSKKERAYELARLSLGDSVDNFGVFSLAK